MGLTVAAEDAKDQSDDQGYLEQARQRFQVRSPLLMKGHREHEAEPRSEVGYVGVKPLDEVVQRLPPSQARKALARLGHPAKASSKQRPTWI